MPGRPAGTAEKERVTLQPWKEIAAFLGFAVSSVQPWEREAVLPVLLYAGSRKSHLFLRHPNPTPLSEEFQ
jgi:hypothetical protein